MDGARVTDAVFFYGRRGMTSTAIKLIQKRDPDALRWRRAMAALAQHAGGLRGRRRSRLEEPVRELTLNLESLELRQEVVLDARRFSVDLDRGEVLPSQTFGALRRAVAENDVELSWLERHVQLPSDVMAPIDTAGCVVVSRAISRKLRERAQKAWLNVPESALEATHAGQFQGRLEHGEIAADLASRWLTVSKSLLASG